MKRILSSGRALVTAAAVIGVIALAGSATAASLVTSAQIKDGTVQSRDVADRSLTGRDVRDRSLTPADYTGSVQAPPGAAGPAGAPGVPGVRGVANVVGDARLLQGGGIWTVVRVDCPTGTKVLSGGMSATTPGVRLLETAPLDGGAGWRVAVRNEGSSDATFYPWAVCATA